MSTARKTPAASPPRAKPAQLPKARPRAKPPKAQAKPKVDDAVNVMMQTIDADYFASSDVELDVQIDFYSQLAQLCKGRASSLKSERGDDESAEDEDEDIDEDDDDEESAD